MRVQRNSRLSNNIKLIQIQSTPREDGNIQGAEADVEAEGRGNSISINHSSITNNSSHNIHSSSINSSSLIIHSSSNRGMVLTEEDQTRT